MALAQKIEKNLFKTEQIIKNFGFGIVSILIPEVVSSDKTLDLLSIDESSYIVYIIMITFTIVGVYLLIVVIKSLYKRISGNNEINEKIEKILEHKNIIEDKFGTHEVEMINDFGNSVIGGNHLPDASIIEQRRNKSPNVIKTISIINGKAKELVGYYVLYPLTNQITEDIIKGDVLNAKQLQLRDITETFDKANSIYIGMLLGCDRVSKAAIEQILVRDIRKYLESNSSIDYVFAKPASDDGHRITSQNGFKPIQNSEIKYMKI